MKYMQVLQTCPLFKGTTVADLEKMTACFNLTVKKYQKNEFITLEGHKFDGIGVLLTGKAAVTKENAAGRRIIMEMLEPGDMFGEMAAFSANKVWPASVLAQEPCAVVFLPPDKLAGNCEKKCIPHQTMIANMLSLISGRALMLTRKVEYLAMKSLRARISTFLLEEYKRQGTLTFMLPMKRNEIADFLNVSRPSLSREMCRMRDEGIIDFHRSSIRIKNLPRLKEITE
ncbi:MAG: Crp/Fnr family transcriptional regulator [Clostridia bacterium]|jgi:CRP-like cAMP-binding protein|nr:Crp/Fnr family transcriptional regulator [Clostridia bacterium]